MWYLIVFLDAICIDMYKWRTSSIKKQFESYRVIYARIVRMNKISFLQGTPRVTYSYKYESHEYIITSDVVDFLRHSYSIKEGNLIKVMVSTDDPKSVKL